MDFFGILWLIEYYSQPYFENSISKEKIEKPKKYYSDCGKFILNKDNNKYRISHIFLHNQKKGL